MSKWAAASEASKRNFTALTITGVTSREEWLYSQGSWRLFPAVPPIYQPALSHLYAEFLKHDLVVWPLLDFYCCWAKCKWLVRHSKSSQHRCCTADMAFGRNFFVLPREQLDRADCFCKILPPDKHPPMLVWLQGPWSLLRHSRHRCNTNSNIFKMLGMLWASIFKVFTLLSVRIE